MKYGLQLYSVRDCTETNFLEALRNVAALGYQMVESAGFFGCSSSEVKEAMDENGLVMIGAHIGVDDIAADLDKTISYHQEIGNKNLIIPGADISTKAAVDTLVEAVNTLIPILRDHGMELYFHNHTEEFLPNQDGIIAFDELMNRTEVKWELDTYWAYAAGKDPLAIMQKYSDRIGLIHLKDGSRDGDGYPLGQGSAPVKAVWKKAIELGYHMVVESETLTPSGLGEAEVCMNYLKGLEDSGA